MLDTSVLKEWHIISAISLMLISIFKSDIKLSINALITRNQQRHMNGRLIQIQSNSGEWEDRKIESYQLPVPFIRAGGVVLVHEDNGVTFRETLSYQSWSQQRVRQTLPQ